MGNPTSHTLYKAQPHDLYETTTGRSRQKEASRKLMSATRKDAAQVTWLLLAWRQASSLSSLVFGEDPNLIIVSNMAGEDLHATTHCVWLGRIQTIAVLKLHLKGTGDKRRLMPKQTLQTLLPSLACLFSLSYLGHSRNSRTALLHKWTRPKRA